MKTVLKVRQEIAHYCIEERKDQSSLFSFSFPDYIEVQNSSKN